MSDGCDENEACFYPFPAKENLFTVRIRPHVGNLSDYPYCITPQQIVCLLDYVDIYLFYPWKRTIMTYFPLVMRLKVIPAKGSGTIHVSFTPLTLSGSARESRCVGLALGFMSLDSKVTCLIQKIYENITWKRQKEGYWCTHTPLLFCVCVHRRLPVSRVKLKEFRVWIWSLSGWIF